MKLSPALLALVLLPIACDDVAPPPPPPPPPPAAASSPWQREEGTAVVIAEDGEDLRDAMQAARDTLADANSRWAAADEADRDRWALKWAATSEDGATTEYLWVFPITWSAYRVEGTLASQPSAAIARAKGDVVSFPAEEIADWIHTLDGPVHTHFDGRREGGFTVAVLQDRYGQPKP